MDIIQRLHIAIEMLNSALPKNYRIDSSVIDNEEKASMFLFLIKKIEKEMS